VEKHGLDRFKARVYLCFGNLVIPWTQHLRAGRALIRRAFDAALEAGDLSYAAYSCNNMLTNLLASGDPLSDVQREAENRLAFAQKARFGIVVDIVTGQLRLILTHRGMAPDFASFNDNLFDEDRFEQRLEGDPQLALPTCWYWIRKLQAHFYAGDPPDLAETRQAVAAMIRDGYRASDVIRRIRALVQHTPPPPAWLEVNALILEVLANALDALRGVPEGGRALQVSAGTAASQGVRVAVRDTGIGLAAASLARLFDAFYTTKAEGMGLGLAISRRIIEAHRGQLWATPNAGRGATFQFTLPTGEEQVS
jgi:hypothetical protein